ncbi:MAG: phosphomannomutase/phosphoglucomutase [Candidatus Moranbacteria bacterium]|nr:phosphomannomutase/phosphoglucomutase [Candidatus Moranbacteria bacterium]
MESKIFKAYDIRGIYPSQIDEDGVYRIGRATAQHLGAKVVAVGRDVRESSPSLFKELVRGLTDSGADVIDLGLATTPMVYFSAGRLELDAAISLTASHNPGEYNGMKICLKEAVPVGLSTGLAEIRDLAMSGDFAPAETVGTVREEDIKPAYYSYFASFAELGDRKFQVVIDTANAMGILELPIYEQFAGNVSVINLWNDLTKPFTCHEANPLLLETLDELRAKVKETGSALGMAYDGDADRVGFVDEQGEIIPMDLMTALIAREILKKKPGSTILYDLRSSRAVKEIIEEHGGVAIECPVGHANIKRMMRDTGAVFAGELSGHYYFEENSVAESSTLTAILLLNLMAESVEPVSEIVAHTKRYVHSGEINSEVSDKDAVLALLEKKYADGKASRIDGIKIDYPTWWFNVRASNTEPLLRLTLEAETQEAMEEKRDELLQVIRG